MQYTIAQRRRLTLRQRQTLMAYLFLVVPLIFFLSIRIGPTLYAFFVSFHKWDPINPTRPWIWFDNYRQLIRDETFRKAFVNTWIYVIVGVPAGLVLSLAVALGLHRITRLVGVYRLLYFIPYITSLVAVSWVWRWLYSSPQGFFNNALRALGLEPVVFLSSPRWAIYAIIAMTVWQGLGFQVIIWLAGLQSIPEVFQEAAKIDGANAWQRFRYITVPLLNPTLVFLSVIGVIGMLQVFTQVRNMSSQGRGGPLDSTMSLVLYTYVKGFDSLPSQYGYASAIVVVLFLIILVITLFQLKVLQKRYEY